MKGTRKNFLSLDLFSLTFKNSFLTVLGGGGIAPIAPVDRPLFGLGMAARLLLRVGCCRHVMFTRIVNVAVSTHAHVTLLLFSVLL